MILPPRIYFCTGNEKKWIELEAILRPRLPATTSLHQARVDLPELQGTLENIAREKCRLASQQLQGAAVITEDTSLGFDDMQGLPGPYIKWFLDSLGLDGLSHLAKSYSGKEDPGAKAICTLAYFDPAQMAEPVLLQGVTPGHIVRPRGPTHFGWDPVFQPEGHVQTYAELSGEVKNTLSHRSRALGLLVGYFGSQ